MVMIMHKLPVACALTTLLMGCPAYSKYLMLSLLVFSLATPAGALFMFVLVNRQTTQGASSMLPLTLAFSGGSFFYVGIAQLLEHARTVQSLTVLGMLVPVVVSILPGDH